MAINSKVLQKKRAKKAAKRKEVRNIVGSQVHPGQAAGWLAAAKAPVADVLTPISLFETGIGNVWFSRRLPDGRYAASVFLVDTFCLGVKNALYALVEPDDYTARLQRMLSLPQEQFERHDPAYARKLVESALAYARDLGFEPHADYKIAKLIFGDVDASACPAEFVFGKDGKPFYISGPNDSPTLQRRILKQLEKRGAGTFDFLLVAE